MLRSEKVRLFDWYGEIRHVSKRHDLTNVKILTAMWKFGPRNLLEVSRRTGIPFTSVYHRVRKLESETGRVAYLVPQVSRLGLVHLTVQAAAKPGREEKITRALKIPGWWQSISACEPPITHHSTHAVPVKFVNDFRKYLRRLIQTGLATQLRVIPTGDPYPNFPNFSRYDPSAKSWSFEWRQWLSTLKRRAVSKTIEDPTDYRTTADRRDLLIVRELQKNARATFAEMGPVLGISLQGVKYHFDKKLVPSGIVKYFGFDITPYPHDLSAAHQILLSFTNRTCLNRFFSSLNEMFFIQDVAKVLKSNSLLARTYVPQNQVPRMFSLFSELAKERVLQTYSAVRLGAPEAERQTVQPGLFVDQKGWMFDSRKYNSDLSKLR